MPNKSEHKNPHVIGLTGSFGSGCSYIAKNILRKTGYEFLSLSENVLRPLYQKKTGKDPNTCPKKELQEFGDMMRKENGAGFFAAQIAHLIKSDENYDKKWVIDSIRNPAEVKVFRESFSHNFFLIGVYADKELRWKRVSGQFDGNRKEFDDDDQNDTGEDNPDHGQKVGDCFYEADIVISSDKNFDEVENEEFQQFAAKIKKYVDLIQNPLDRQQPIEKHETLMATAYAVSQNSSCNKRKVGAIIIDSQNTIISSGYNEIPAHETPCSKKFKKCHRDWFVEHFFSDIDPKKITLDQTQKETLKELFTHKFRNLDYCRALHAEENAIVNLARNGHSVSLRDCILYTTTYPCRMCANKIVNLGIQQIVYLEPYPDEAAKSILRQGGVKDIFFNGVTFRAYFRVYGEEK